MDNAKDLDVVMPVYNLMEYSDNVRKHQEVCGNITDMIQILI